jgi:hypothetical protein
VTGYGLDGWGTIPSRGKRFFCYPQRLDSPWGLAILLFYWHGGLYPRVKRTGHETDPLPPSSERWIYTSTPFYVFMAWYSIKHRENFTLTLIFIINSVALVRKRTIPTELPPLVGEVSANLCGKRCCVVSVTNSHGR